MELAKILHMYYSYLTTSLLKKKFFMVSFTFLFANQITSLARGIKNALYQFFCENFRIRAKNIAYLDSLHDKNNIYFIDKI